jgi:septum site-determining protein MinC
MAMLVAEFQAHYGDVPDFFGGELLLIDLTLLPAGTTHVDFEYLKALLIQHRLRPVAVTGGTPELMMAALHAGLPAAPSDWRETPAQQQQQQVSRPPPLTEPIVKPPPESLSPGALIIDKPLRAGQQIYARGRDLVLLAVCNPGAEAIADGHIHVYAPLHGRAIAGARGWHDARIFAQNMQAQLVSIAGIYCTSDQGMAPEIWSHAAMVRLATTEDRDTLVFQPLI